MYYISTSVSLVLTYIRQNIHIAKLQTFMLLNY